MKKTILLFLLSYLLQASTPQANVTSVTPTGEEGSYHFDVTIKSDELGCEQYADWWEVLNEQGKLIYRRILIHSHPDMQPFTRLGGYVKIKKDDIVYVRAHMNTFGYVGDIFKGNVINGFKKVENFPEFEESVETENPLPTGCLY